MKPDYEILAAIPIKESMAVLFESSIFFPIEFLPQSTRRELRFQRNEEILQEILFHSSMRYMYMYI